MNIVGLDVGYGYTKAVNSRTVILPSVVGPAVDVRYNDHDLIGNGEARSLTLDGQSWFAGENALLQSPFQISPRARERDVETVKLLALFALTGLRITGECALVTGLPVAWYGDREAQAHALLGEHDYTFGDSEDNCAYYLNIATVKVVPQPFGCFFRTIIEPDGRILDRQGLARKRVAVIDVGTHTTDYAVSDALRYVDPKSGSIDVAMARVYELIQRQVERETGRVLSDRDAEIVSRVGVYADAGQEIDASAIRDHALETVGRQVLAQAQQLWGAGRDLSAVLVTGGGGHAFIDRINAQYPQARLVENSQIANAEGFYRYGLRKWGASHASVIR